VYGCSQRQYSIDSSSEGWKYGWERATYFYDETLMEETSYVFRNYCVKEEEYLRPRWINFDDGADPEAQPGFWQNFQAGCLSALRNPDNN
jgi:hypothetical protein